jgi:hypothetical protein
VADTLYKVLQEDGSCYHGGRGSWPLPRPLDGGIPGRPISGDWVEAPAGTLIPCRRGIHLCRRDDLIHWLGPAIFVAQADGDERIDHGDKIVVRKARLLERVETWNETTMVLFAADCAEAVLHYFEDALPGDDRPRKAIEAARAYARGEVDAAGAAEAAEAARAARAARAAGAAEAAEAAEAQTALLFDYLEGRKVA